MAADLQEPPELAVDMFNTLGAIIVLIRQQKTQQAEAMVARLGDLLRLTLEDVQPKGPGTKNRKK